MNTKFEWWIIALGGLPFYLPILIWLGEPGLSSQQPIYWYFWANALVSSPHVYSTYLRFARKADEGKVSRWIGWTGYLACFAALFLAWKTGYLLQTLTAINVWQSVHYVRQGYGVNRLFSRGTAETDTERSLMWWAFHLAMPLFVFGRWDTLYTVWNGQASEAIIPYRFPEAFMMICWALFFGSVAMGVWVEGKKAVRMKSDYPRIGIVTLLVFYAIHVYGFLSVSHFQRGFFAVTLFHALQYLGLVWVLENQSKSNSLFDRLRALPFVFFWVVLFVMSYLWENHISTQANLLVPMLATIALGAVSAHHYLMDTWLWRRSVGK